MDQIAIVEDPSLISEAQLSPQNLIVVAGTQSRDRAKDFYLLRMSRRRQRQLGIGDWAVVVFDHPLRHRSKEFSGVQGPLSGYTVVHCRVEGVSDKYLKSKHEKFAARCTKDPEAIQPPRCDPTYWAEIDQTLRNALGIPAWVGYSNTDVPLYVYPLKYRPNMRERISGLFGRRYMFFRVARAAVPDIEKRVVRLEHSAFALLGLGAEGRVVVERPMKNPLSPTGKIVSFRLSRQRIKAFPASDALLERRRQQQKLEPKRYFEAERHLYEPSQFGYFRGTPPSAVLVDAMLEPDIPTIFADADFRNHDCDEYNAAMGPLTAVAVRRDVGDVVVRELQDFVLALAISGSPLIFSVSSWLSGARLLEGGAWSFIAEGLLVVLLPIVVLMLLWLRVRRLVV